MSTMIVSNIVIIASISTAFSLILLFTLSIVRYKEDGQTKRDLMSTLFWMSLSDFGMSISLILQLYGSPSYKLGYVYCYISAYGQGFFGVATQSWYFIICIQIILSMGIFKSASAYQWCKKKWLHHLYVWSVSIIMSVIPYHSYGFDSSIGVCWIIKNIPFYSIFMFVPLTFYLGFALVLFYLMNRYLRSAFEKTQMKQILLHTSFFVGVFVIGWFPSWLSFLFDIVSFNLPILFRGIIWYFWSSSGILNFVVWIIYIPDIRNWLKLTFKKKQNNYEEQDQNDFTCSFSASINDEISSFNLSGASNFSAPSFHSTLRHAL